MTIHPVLPSEGRKPSALRTKTFSRLDIQPARTPVNASRMPSRTSPHDSEPVWLARPSPYETLIHNTSPALPAHASPFHFPTRACRSRALRTTVFQLHRLHRQVLHRSGLGWDALATRTQRITATQARTPTHRQISTCSGSFGAQTRRACPRNPWNSCSESTRAQKGNQTHPSP